MNQEDQAKLWDANIAVIDEMNVSAGSVIKQMLVTLRSLDTFISLSDPTGHDVTYSMEDGDENWIVLVADDLGITEFGGKLIVADG